MRPAKCCEIRVKPFVGGNRRLYLIINLDPFSSTTIGTKEAYWLISRLQVFVRAAAKRAGRSKR
jgi:hypothetical protein